MNTKARAELAERTTSNNLSSFSIGTFCERNEMSRGFYYKMKRKRIGPREMDVDGLKRITAEAEADWKAEREAATAAEQTEQSAA